MLRNIFIALFGGLYLLMQIGISRHAHYCGNEQTATWYWLSPDNKCGCGDEEMLSNCCHEVHSLVKVNDSQVLAHHFYSPNASYILLPALLVQCQWLFADWPSTSLHKTLQWPPPLLHVPLFVRCMNFRI